MPASLASSKTHLHGYRRLLRCDAFEVAEYVCGGEPPVTEVEAARFPEIVMVRAGAFVRCDAAGMAFLDPTVIGFFEAHRPYTIRHPEPRPDVSTVIAIRDIDALAEALGTAMPSPDVFRRSVVRATVETRLLHRRLLKACRTPGYEALAEELAVTLILDAAAASHDLVITEDGDLPPHKRQALAIANYINRRYRGPVALRDIGAAIGLSPFQVCRIFRAHMGATVRQHVMALRVDAATAALLETGASITEIALESGFSSHSHLTATMKRLLGATPNEVRAGCGRERA